MLSWKANRGRSSKHQQRACCDEGPTQAVRRWRRRMPAQRLSPRFRASLSPARAAIAQLGVPNCSLQGPASSDRSTAKSYRSMRSRWCPLNQVDGGDAGEAAVPGKLGFLKQLLRVSRNIEIKARRLLCPSCPLHYTVLGRRVSYSRKPIDSQTTNSHHGRRT